MNKSFQFTKTQQRFETFLPLCDILGTIEILDCQHYIIRVKAKPLSKNFTRFEFLTNNHPNFPISLSVNIWNLFLPFLSLIPRRFIKVIKQRRVFHRSEATEKKRINEKNVNTNILSSQTF